MVIIKFRKNYDKFIELKKSLENNKENARLQHDKGKLTALERINILLDEDSFIEMQPFVELKSANYDLNDRKKLRDGVVIGYGKISKRSVCIYAQDFTFMGGSMGEMHNKKISYIMDLAMKTGAPCIGIFDSGGARIQEGVSALDTGGAIFYRNTLMSGIVPQIAIIMGPCAGIAVYSPALNDFVFMVRDISCMFITGPDVIKTVTGEEINFEELGGASAQDKSGVAHFIAENEKECLEKVKLLLAYLPQNNLENPLVLATGDNPLRQTKELEGIVPDDSKKAYDMRDVISKIVDKKTFFEVQANHAQNAVIGFARLNAVSVGIVANQPRILAGCLDIDSSNKIARFVRFCDNFNIPLVNIVDVTGYLPGAEQEHRGIIRHGAKVLYAYSEATVPKIALVLRKAYGGAYIALASKEMGYDKVIAWSNSEIAVMGAEQAVNVIHRKELNKSKDTKLKEKKIEEYSDFFLNPFIAAKEGRVDIIIEPKETRITLIKCLEMMMSKRDKRPAKKHGNMPL